MNAKFRAILLPALLLTIAVLAFSISITSGQGPEPRPEKLDATLLGMMAKETGQYKNSAIGSGSGIEPNKKKKKDAGSPESAGFALSAFTDDRSAIRALIKTDGSLDGLDELGVEIQSVVGSVVAVSIPSDSLLQLTSLSNVEYIEAAHKLSLSNDISVPTTGAPGFHDSDIDGSGVIVAVIDSGVDFTHDDFRNSDGTTRIKFICDQTDPPQGGDNTCPGNGTFDGGTLWTESQINAALTGSGTVRQVDDNGHGTSLCRRISQV